VTLASFALATRARLGFEVFSARDLGMAELISDALMVRGGSDAGRHLPGVGLWLDDGQLFPTVAADRSVVDHDTNDLLPIDRTPAVREILGSLLGYWSDELEQQLRVLPVTEGILQSYPGTKLTCTTSGRMGPHVRWGGGKEGFLTAGHVAQTIGASVSDSSGQTLGSVLFSRDPALAPLNWPEVDVALVEFASAHPAATGRSSIRVGAGDLLGIAATGAQSAVLGYWGHIRLGAAQAIYAECYATEQRITQSGDSGGLVEAQGDVAGMVIGGFAGRDMTVVQAIDYQLSAVRFLSGCMISL
jgi:hypothetical protein